jgi:hypothetical protein
MKIPAASSLSTLFPAFARELESLMLALEA